MLRHMLVLPGRLPRGAEETAHSVCACTNQPAVHKRYYLYSASCGACFPGCAHSPSLPVTAQHCHLGRDFSSLKPSAVHL
eukprot:1160287-Pelagomonas_calceolata.AAC.10